MTNIRNRLEIKNSILEDESGKKLPNFFNTNDDIKFFKGICMSVAFHAVFIAFMVVFASVFKAIMPEIQKPKEQPDVVFNLIEPNKKPPINKKTKIASHENSQAGGKHDPKKPVAQPTPKGKDIKKSPAPAKKAQVQKPKNIIDNIKPQKKVAKQSPAPAPIQPKQQIKSQVPSPKQAQKSIAAPTPAINKPAPIKAPSNVKPTISPIKPSATPVAPKIATAPAQGTFKVAVPPSKNAVGSMYRPPASGSASGSASGGSAGGNLAPKFSSAKGTGSGYGNGSGNRGGSSTGSKSGVAGGYGSKGSYGGGSGGNPSPGNPNGAPGVDAIKHVNWGPYMHKLETSIKRNWFPPKGDTSKRVVVEFAIAKDGRLRSYKITKSSGSALADQAAIKAIEATAPFDPLPPDYRGSQVNINFTFDYNVLNAVAR